MRSSSRVRVLVAASFIGCVSIGIGALPSAASTGPLPIPTGLPVPTPTPAATPTSIPLPAPTPTLPQQLPVPLLNGGPPLSPPSYPVLGQPPVPTPACSMPALQPTEMRTVADLVRSPYWWWGGAVAVDPTNPCHLFAGADATSCFGQSDCGYPQAVFRGDTTNPRAPWPAVFSTPLPPESAFAVPAFGTPIVWPPSQPLPVVDRSGSVWLTVGSDQLGGLARVYRSQDAGQHWEQRDNGFAVQVPDVSWAQTFPAPSDAQTLYVLTGGHYAESSAVLHATHDAGATWVTESLPATTVSAPYQVTARFTIDPGDAMSVFYIPPDTNTLWTSSNGGLTWTPTASTVPLPPGPTPLNGSYPTEQAIATHPPGRGVQLYVHTGGQWFHSADVGRTWQPLPLPSDRGFPSLAAFGYDSNGDGECYRPCFEDLHGVPLSFLVADPTNPDVMVWAMGGSDEKTRYLDLVMTDNGFSQPPLRVLRIATPADSLGMGVDGLQTDSRGDFFLTVDRRLIDQGGRTSAGSHDAWAYTASTVVAFRPSMFYGSNSGVVGGTAPTPIGFGTEEYIPPPPRPPGYQTVPPGPTETSAASCAVPAGAAGNIAFDGRYVDYSQDEASPGSIFRIDAAGCTTVPPLVLRTQDFPSGMLPSFHSLSFDSRYLWQDGRMGAILGAATPGSDPRVATTSVPIYAIDPVTAVAVLLTSVSTYTPPSSRYCTPGQQSVSAIIALQGGCSAGTRCFNPAASTSSSVVATTSFACLDTSFFSYDVYGGGIWSLGTPPGGGNGVNDPHQGYLDVDGTFHDSCVSELGDNFGAAVAGGDGYLYLLAEDDATVVKMATSDCRYVSSLTLAANAGENSNEEEQMACDPLSFSVPVLWVRNSVTGSADSYPIPDAYCPFPTRLTMISGPTSARPGNHVTFCYSLAAALDGSWQQLANQPISVNVGVNHLGDGITDAAGKACVTSVGLFDPGSFPVTASFAGTQAYLPSQAQSNLSLPTSPVGLVVAGLALPPVGGSLGGPLSSAQTGLQSASSASAQSASQAESLTQIQTQAQSQAQASTATQLQAGMSVQRQRRTQVATQAAAVTEQNSYKAVALQRAQSNPLVAVAAGVLMFMLGILVRRPQVARARRQERRRTRS